MHGSTRFGERTALLALLTVLTFAACASPKPGADSTNLTAVDTMKPAAATMPARETTSAAPSKTTTTKTTTRTTTKATSTKTVKDTTILGRDSAIKINTRDPRRQLPTIPPQKPPQ